MGVFLKSLGRLLEKRLSMDKIASLFVFFMRLVPAAVLFALFFSFEGNMRWLGLLGFIPLVLAFNKGCTACLAHPDENTPDYGWKPWAGH